MGLLDQFGEFVRTPEGQGLISAVAGGMAGARRGTPWNNFGRAGLAGLSGYAGAIDSQTKAEETALQKQQRTMQMDELKRKQAEAAAQQQWRAGLTGVMKPSDSGEVNQGAVNDYMMRPDSPFLDDMLKQQLFPKAEDYRVVGGDLVKIGKGGVTVAHQSQRSDNLPSDQKLYNLAVEQGYKGDFMSFLRDRISNTEGARAAYDVMPVTRPDGTTYFMPRSAVATQAGGGSRPSGYQGGSASAAASDQRQILSRELEKAQAEGRGQDVAALQRELERLPGGVGMQVQSKAQEAAAVEAAKAKAAFEDPIAVSKREKKNEGTKAAAKNVLSAISDAKSMVGYGTAGIGSILTGVRGSSAKDLSTKLETIKANLGFDRLQEMRDQSPTGGALGAIAVQELTALQSTVASLDQSQSPEQLRQSLEKIESHYNRWMQTIGDSGNVPEKSSGASGSWEPSGKASAVSSGGWSATLKK